jgi:hypothetical protein
MRMPSSVALITISDAYSMPVVRSAMRRKASAETPRMPQWKSRAGQPKRIRPAPESSGLPRCRFFQGIAPGAIPPRNRFPMTRSDPSRSFSRNGPRAEKS